MFSVVLVESKSRHKEKDETDISKFLLAATQIKTQIAFWTREKFIFQKPEETNIVYK